MRYIEGCYGWTLSGSAPQDNAPAARIARLGCIRNRIAKEQRQFVQSAKRTSFVCTDGQEQSTDSRVEGEVDGSRLKPELTQQSGNAELVSVSGKTNTLGPVSYHGTLLHQTLARAREAPAAWFCRDPSSLVTYSVYTPKCLAALAQLTVWCPALTCLRQIGCGAVARMTSRALAVPAHFSNLTAPSPP